MHTCRQQAIRVSDTASLIPGLSKANKGFKNKKSGGPLVTFWILCIPPLFFPSLSTSVPAAHSFPIRARFYFFRGAQALLGLFRCLLPILLPIVFFVPGRPRLFITAY